ncbi:MAG TPA: LuxR C-terminal-related transcriptional regulator [Candidatus Peribacterales bacterium]|nr:LuxR C-terminal-related transcriptional regulator [Candidatus Peribacterales bacterium]
MAKKASASGDAPKSTVIKGGDTPERESEQPTKKEIQVFIAHWSDKLREEMKIVLGEHEIRCHCFTTDDAFLSDDDVTGDKDLKKTQRDARGKLQNSDVIFAPINEFTRAFALPEYQQILRGQVQEDGVSRACILYDPNAAKGAFVSPDVYQTINRAGIVEHAITALQIRGYLDIDDILADSPRAVDAILKKRWFASTTIQKQLANFLLDQLQKQKSSHPKIEVQQEQPIDWEAWNREYTNYLCEDNSRLKRRWKQMLEVSRTPENITMDGEQSDTEIKITARRQEVLELLAERLSNKQIARRLSVSLYTVKNHVHDILELFGVDTRLDAVDAWKIWKRRRETGGEKNSRKVLKGKEKRVKEEETNE